MTLLPNEIVEHIFFHINDLKTYYIIISASRYFHSLWLKYGKNISMSFTNDLILYNAETEIVCNLLPGNVKHGVENGYYQNGQLWFRNNYIFGKKDGYRIKFYRSKLYHLTAGNIYKISKYTMGIKQNKATYYDNENLKHKVSYLLGLKQGLDIKYYPCESIKEEKNWYRGLLHGTQRQYYQCKIQTKLKSIKGWTYGVMNGFHKKYDLNGKLTFMALWEHGTCQGFISIDDIITIVNL